MNAYEQTPAVRRHAHKANEFRTRAQSANDPQLKEGYQIMELAMLAHEGILRAGIERMLLCQVRLMRAGYRNVRA